MDEVARTFHKTKVTICSVQFHPLCIENIPHIITPTFTAFIDLQKAFDFVNRDLLLNKILANGIDSKVFLAIKSLYSYTEACVKLPGGLYTDWFQTSFGVKQGDTLSPTLFSVFLNDLATIINDLIAGVNNLMQAM